MFDREGTMVRAVIEEAAAFVSIVLFIGMIAVWAQVLSSACDGSEPGAGSRVAMKLCMARSGLLAQWTDEGHVRGIAEPRDSTPALPRC